MIIIEFIIWKFFKHELKIIKWIQIVSKYQNNRTLKKNSPFYLLHSGVETIIKFTYHMKNWTINKTNWARWRIRLEEEISDRGGGGGGGGVWRFCVLQFLAAGLWEPLPGVAEFRNSLVRAYIFTRRKGYHFNIFWQRGHIVRIYATLSTAYYIYVSLHIDTYVYIRTYIYSCTYTLYTFHEKLRTESFLGLVGWILRFNPVCASPSDEKSPSKENERCDKARKKTKSVRKITLDGERPSDFIFFNATVVVPSSRAFGISDLISLRVQREFFSRFPIFDAIYLRLGENIAFHPFGRSEGIGRKLVSRFSRWRRSSGECVWK